MWIIKAEQRRLSISGLYCTVVLRVRERCGQVCAHQDPAVRALLFSLCEFVLRKRELDVRQRLMRR